MMSSSHSGAVIASVPASLSISFFCSWLYSRSFTMFRDVDAVEHTLQSSPYINVLDCNLLSG